MALTSEELMGIYTDLKFNANSEVRLKAEKELGEFLTEIGTYVISDQGFSGESILGVFLDADEKNLSIPEKEKAKIYLKQLVEKITGEKEVLRPGEPHLRYSNSGFSLGDGMVIHERRLRALVDSGNFKLPETDMKHLEKNIKPSFVNRIKNSSYSKGL